MAEETYTIQVAARTVVADGWLDEYRVRFRAHQSDTVIAALDARPAHA